MIYQTVDDVPEWGRASVEKAIKQNLISITVNISEDFVRVLVVLDKLGFI